VELVSDEDDSSVCWGKAVTNGESSGSSPMLNLEICTKIVGVHLTGDGD
jgi:hypothetical protein